MTGKIEGSPPSDPDKPNKYRDLSPDALKAILDRHKEWIESNEKRGEKANLRGANLANANLSGVNLSKADLSKADLSKADLSKADLSKANLNGAMLQEANLSNAYLRTADLFRANLVNANLSGADFQSAVLLEAKLSNAVLTRANLKWAVLVEANLASAHLDGANLQHAWLEGAMLTGAQLSGATFRNTNLQDATLSEVRGLTGLQLAGANVSGAKLPEDIKEFDGLKVVEDASRNARKLFMTMLLACVYSILTIVTTTDLNLITNSASSPLPVIRTPVPIAGFYWAAPAFVFGIYLYFHVSMQRLWEGLADLPAYFPDGKPLDKKAFPWLLLGLVRSHVPLLKEERPRFAKLQSLMAIVLAWWTVPFTLYLFWARYVPRHHLPGTAEHIALLAIAVFLGLQSYRHAADTLAGKAQPERAARSAHPSDRRIRLAQHLRDILGTLGQARMFAFTTRRGWMSVTAALGLSLVAALSGAAMSTFDAPTLQWIRYRPNADLSYQDISEKLNGWREDSTAVRGAELRGVNLRYARLDGAFLVNAHLDSAKMEYASLIGAKLRGDTLRFANLSHANFRHADLIGADLGDANLTDADLTGADLTRAVFYRTDLTRTIFAATNLWRVNVAGRQRGLGVLLERAVESSAVCVSHPRAFLMIRLGLLEPPAVPQNTDEFMQMCEIRVAGEPQE